MINRSTLLSDLQKLLQRLEADLLERSESAEVPEVGQSLRAEYDRAKTAERTAQNYEDWRTDGITQTSAAWVLSCVFVRFLEDNRLIDPPKIAGPDDRLQRSRDEHELYFREHPKQTDRDYLLAVFDQLAKLPGTKDVFGEHNPIRELPNWLSGDAAGELLKFFQKIDANTGVLVHDFTDPNWDTRFLGDLYQDLSEAARKKYALLQTPEFVEKFILERTLEPALDEFGLIVTRSASDPQPSTLDPQPFKMIDPACGSGHFLLGAFRRILDRWQQAEPATNERVLVQRTLDSVHGVDVNPFAIAIARFRLLLAAMRACGIARLADAPAFRLNLVCGDSLLHAPLAAGGKKYTAGQQELDFALANDPADSDECAHAYRSENLPELKRLLRGGQYHAVVANPPYIVPRDKQLSKRYKQRFTACHDQYSLAAPFMQFLFRLGVAAAYVGQITTASFSKREYGKKLVEEWIPLTDITTVVDSSGAYIPGHNNAGDGTTTIILFGRQRCPVAHSVRVVMGLRAEPGNPLDPSLGKVWNAILTQIDRPGSESEFIGVADFPRERFCKHPWTIGGGGAAELKGRIDESSALRLSQLVTAIGRGAHTGEDEVYVVPYSCLCRNRVPKSQIVPFVAGDSVRDWEVKSPWSTAFPYSDDLAVLDIESAQVLTSIFWPYRNQLWNRVEGGGTHRTIGLTWFEFSRFHPERFVGRCITYGEIASHNHFASDLGNKVFNRTAPVIKLRSEREQLDYIGLLGVLNSSVGLFWGRQTLFPKGGFADGKWEERLVWNSTNMMRFPIPRECPKLVTQECDKAAKQLTDKSPPAVLRNWQDLLRQKAFCDVSLRGIVGEAQTASNELRGQMIAYQEELDWECYRLYGLIAAPTERQGYSRRSQADKEPAASAWRLSTMQPPPLKLGQRAFEIVLARKMAAGETQTTWFERHGSTPITELPAEWPDDYRQLVERRIALIESDPNIRLIEQPEYKRRWNTEPWDSQLARALREWLLNRLESCFDFDGRMNDPTPRREGAKEEDQPQSLCASAPLREISLYSVAKLADIARQDAEFQQVGELFRDDPAFDVQALVGELVAAECVPLLPVLRYKPSGLIKRGTWERTWDLQRQEDAIDTRTKLPSNDPDYLSEDAARDFKQTQVGNIPVPTKYESKDFLDSNLWRLRGKLDVPKERWISFPHCEGPDGTLVICWAGYDHLQQAQAISAYYVRVQTELGGSDDIRLIPLLACLLELLPWLKQWHNDPDQAFDGMRMGDYFEGFINEEARQLNKTIPEIKAWTPPRTSGRGRRRST